MIDGLGCCSYFTLGMLVVAAASLCGPVRRFSRNQRRLARQRRGQCPGCGYDLRYSRKRCPECGEPIILYP